MKTIDLRQQEMTVDQLLQTACEEPVRVTSREGEEFLLEAADAFDREAAELGQSAKFRAFLAERSAETGRISLEEIEARLAGTHEAP